MAEAVQGEGLFLYEAHYNLHIFCMKMVYEEKQI